MPVVFRICVNLYYKLLRAMIYPIFLIKTRGLSIAIFVVAIYAVYQFNSSPDEPAAIRIPQGAIGTVQAIHKHEDGNSSFASDLLPQMTPEALKYYSQVYYWVMANQPTSEPYSWKYHGSHGSFTPAAMFKNNYGHRCRRFAEVLKVGTTQQTLNGIACEKPDGSWCKLGKNYTPICGISPRRGFGAWWERTMDSLF